MMMTTTVCDTNQLYRLIFESAHDYAIFTLDNLGRITSWNPGAEKLFRYFESEIIGRNISTLFRPRDRRQRWHRCEMAQAFQNGRAEDTRWLLRKDGTVFWANGLLMPLRNDSGKLIGFLKIVRDSTPEKIVEETNERFRLLVEHVKDYAIFMLDKKGVVTNWNSGAERIKGYKADEIIGRHVSAFYTPEDRRLRLPQKELARALREGRFETEGWRMRKNRSRFWVNEVIAPIKNEFGEVIGFTKISRDLTDQREAENALRMMNESLERRVRERTAALEISQRELKSLALQLSRAELRERQRIAAEIHSHLAQLLALAKIRVACLARPVGRRKPVPAIDDLQKYIEHAIHYTRSLLSRLSPPVLKKKNLGLVVQAVVAEMQTHGLNVEVLNDRRPKPVDPERLALLYHTIRELLFNVLKHARTQKAQVKLRRVNGSVEVHVQDHGVGFRRQRVHEKAYGFGLSHLRDRLSLVGGKLEILPNGARGTHVLVSLPLKLSATKEKMRGRRRQKRTSRANRHIRVLIVDDNELMREGLRKVLGEQSDLKIVGEASNGQTAVALSRKTRPDIVLMDVNMPEMDGIEATRQIAGRSGGPRVIGFSIHDDKEIEASIRRAGALAYITKQQTPEKLYSVIRDSVKAQTKFIARRNSNH